MTNIPPQTVTALLTAALRPIRGVKIQAHAVDTECRRTEARLTDRILLVITAAVSPETAQSSIVKTLVEADVTDVMVTTSVPQERGPRMQQVSGAADDDAASAVAGIRFSFAEAELQYAVKAMSKLADVSAAAKPRRRPRVMQPGLMATSCRQRPGAMPAPPASVA